MKKKLGIILAIVIVLAGVITTVIWGFRFDLVYDKNTQIDIRLNKTFKEEDIKNIVYEVTNNKNVIVQKVELYEDMVSIKIKDISDEQISEINTKINEKYELENTVEKNVTISQNDHVRGRDIVKPYIVPTIVSVICIILYIIVYMLVYRYMGNKKNIIKSVAKIIFMILSVQLIYLSIIAITRLPINRYTIPVGMVIYIITTVVEMYKLEKEYKKQ